MARIGKSFTNPQEEKRKEKEMTNSFEDDFIAEIKFKNTEDGGRKGYTASGYWGQVKFPFSEIQTGGRQIFHDKEKVYPGETVGRPDVMVLAYLLL